MALNKTTVVAVVAVLVVAAVGIYVFLGDSEEYGVTYYGNGGKTSEGKTEYTHANEKVSPCLFTNGTYPFTSFNTKADGSGEMYRVGDSVSIGTKLYAQWDTEDKYFITGVGSSGPVPDNFYVEFVYNGNNNDHVTIAPFNPVLATEFSLHPMTSSAYITSFSGTNWEHKENGTFTATFGEKEYEFEFTVKPASGSDKTLYDCIYLETYKKNVPVIKLNPESDLYLSIKSTLII